MLLAVGIGTFLAGVSTGAKCKQNNCHWLILGTVFEAVTFLKAKNIQFKIYTVDSL